MREIKFRAWCKKHKYMYDVCSLQFIGEKVGANDNKSCLDDEIIMQYTGLKESKNLIGKYDKKEIYEGDIIQEDGWDDLYVVKFEDCKFIAENISSICNDKDLNNVLWPIVVGNIYENPELLKD